MQVRTSPTHNDIQFVEVDSAIQLRRIQKLVHRSTVLARISMRIVIVGSAKQLDEAHFLGVQHMEGEGSKLLYPDLGQILARIECRQHCRKTPKRLAS